MRPEYRTSWEKSETSEMTDKEIEREIQRVLDRLKSLAGEEHGGQSELARAIGVPRQRLFDWLTGKSTPDVSVAQDSGVSEERREEIGGMNRSYSNGPIRYIENPR